MGEEQAKSEPDALVDFEQSMGELEALVEALEAGDTSLDDSLAKFERGITLARHCQTLLKAAELRVEQLLENDGETQITAFEEPQE